MAALREATPQAVAELRRALEDGSTPLPHKYRVLFSLRNLKGDDAREALIAALKDDSALLRHEVAYCLGQRQDPKAVEILKRTLADGDEHPMVRHEAGEALGAIGTAECMAPLQRHEGDACLEVAQTCQLARQRVEYYHQQQQQQEAGAGQGREAAAAGTSGQQQQGQQGEEPSPYLSVDPTPAADAGTPTPALRAALLDEHARIFDRYRAMFALRNRGGPDAVAALAAAFASSSSALLKHEVAYVLGQMQDGGAVAVLRGVLADPAENAMVRHEAAEALGAISSGECVAALRAFATDPEPIVAHSCEVALDMLEHEQSGAFEYAAVGGGGGGAPAVAASS